MRISSDQFKLIKKFIKTFWKNYHQNIGILRFCADKFLEKSIRHTSGLRCVRKEHHPMIWRMGRYVRNLIKIALEKIKKIVVSDKKKFTKINDIKYWRKKPAKLRSYCFFSYNHFLANWHSKYIGRVLCRHL